MAITYPRDFPAGIRFADGCTFELMPVEATNRVNESEVSMQLGDPYWVAHLQTVPVVQSDRDALCAWKDTLRGSRTFYGFHPFRVYPIFYGAAVLGLTRAGGGAFDGTAKITANSSNSITLATLANAQKLSAGDFVELPRANAQIGLHRVVENATASAGGVAEVSVEPPAFADSIINATSVRLVRARCTMSIKTGSWSAPGGSAKPVSFDAVQTLVGTRKPFDSATVIALGKRRASMTCLLQFVLDEGTFGFHTRSGDFVYQGVTYRGAGKFISVKSLGGSGNFAVSPVSVVLSSIPDAALTPDVLGTVFDYTWHQRPAVLYDAYLHPDTGALIKVERIARRRIDTIEMIEAVDGTAQLVARLMPLNFDNPNRGYMRYGDPDQRLIDPTDGYFSFSATAGTRDIEWGRAPTAIGGAGTEQGVGG